MPKPVISSNARRAGPGASLLLCAACCLPAIALGEAPGSAESDGPGERPNAVRDALPAIEAQVATAMAQQQVPGYAWGLIADGELLHVATGGLRDVSEQAPVESDTVFRIASMSKSFAAAAILQLRDAGRLALDDPAQRYVPELASLTYPSSDSPPITVRHLLTHSAGFPEDNPWGDQQLAMDDDAFGALLRSGVPFSSTPGIAYEYSNLGFALLGRIVANISGQSYAQYLRESLLLPLGLGDTTLEAAQVPPERLALGYRVRDGQWLLEPALADGAFGAMGGLLTSADDLGRWVAFLLDAWPARDGPDSAVLSRASRREMQQMWRFAGAAARHNDGEVALDARGYGYGLRIGQDCRFGHSVAHGGGLPGYGSLMYWLPEYGVGLIAMGNRTYLGWSGLFSDALDALAEHGALKPRAAQPSAALLALKEEVTTLVLDWDAERAERIAAMNLFLDEPQERRAAAIAAQREAAGGDCRAEEGSLWVENALRGEWALQCAASRLRVRITLAPTTPPRVQHLSVSPLAAGESPGPAPRCR